jgi:hypothetical protein
MVHLLPKSQQFQVAMLGEKPPSMAQTELVNVFVMIQAEYQEAGKPAAIGNN